MKFFVPFATTEEKQNETYQAIKKFVGGKLSDRRIRVLQWEHDGKNFVAEVGKNTSFNNEMVMAILFSDISKSYHVCTPTRGVANGPAIRDGLGCVQGTIDFDPTSDSFR